jgi:hypothetical protein
MRLSPKRMSGRVAATVNRAAAGSEVPAGQDPATAAATTARERGVMRRRVRRLRRVREVLLHELGALVFEMERRGRSREPLLRRKLDQLQVVEDEAGGLLAALGDERSLVEVVSAGIVGACGNCGTLVSTDAHFCSNCATSVSARARTSAPVAAVTPPASSAPGGSTPAPAGAPPATATLPTEGAPPAGAVPQRTSDASSTALGGGEEGQTREANGAQPKPLASGSSPAVPENAERSAAPGNPPARG